MNAPPTKKGSRPLSSKTATAAKLTKINPEQAVVERLQTILAEIDRLPLPVGETGCAFLDCLELTDKIRSKVREKARQVLLREPGIIPNWRAVECSPSRTIDARQAFKLIKEKVSAEEFIAECQLPLSGARKLIEREMPPEATNGEIELEIHRVFAPAIRWQDGVVRLVRSKERQLKLRLE